MTVAIIPKMRLSADGRANLTYLRIVKPMLFQLYLVGDLFDAPFAGGVIIPQRLV